MPESLEIGVRVTTFEIETAGEEGVELRGFKRGRGGQERGQYGVELFWRQVLSSKTNHQK